MLTSSSSIAGLVSQAATLSEQQSEIVRQLSTGTRLTRLSNDPLAAAATVRLSSGVAETTAEISAIKTTQARMQTADAALRSVVTQLTSAISIAVRATNETNNATDRSAAAAQLSSIRQAVAGLANSSHGGVYLFGGTAAGAAPFSSDPVTGDVIYGGDTNSMTLLVQGSRVETSVSGATVFGSGSSSVFARMQSVIDTLQAGGTPTTEQVTGMRDGLDTVILGRSLLGGSSNRLEDAATTAATQLTNLMVEQTTVAASDPIALATALSSTQAQRSALLSSLATLGKNNLFDYL